MEPITHLMTGAVLARTGFNRKAAYATASNDPSRRSSRPRHPMVHPRPHRSLPASSRLDPHPPRPAVRSCFDRTGAIWLFHRWRSRPQRSPRNNQNHALPYDPTTTPAPPLTTPPSVGACSTGFSLIALLSHLLLDWTNNYGLRPFFPFNPPLVRWLHLSSSSNPSSFSFCSSLSSRPALFGLINSEVGARKQAFRGRGWAIFALVAIVALWTLRFVQHAKALQLAQSTDYRRSPYLTCLSPVPTPSILFVGRPSPKPRSSTS